MRRITGTGAVAELATVSEGAAAGAAAAGVPGGAPQAAPIRITTKAGDNHRPTIASTEFAAVFDPFAT
jgi:hypothetical protein